jgi:hypothetical protein
MQRQHDRQRPRAALARPRTPSRRTQPRTTVGIEIVQSAPADG